MSGNALSSYLIELGFSAEPDELRKLDTFLGKSTSLVTSHVTGIAKDLLTFQGSVLAGFSAIGLGAIGIVANAAKADQQFRLLGERTFQTTENVRKFTAVQQILGASLDEIAFDPELLKREQALSAQLDKVNSGLGGGYEDRLKTVRDYQTQFGLLRYELEALLPDAISKAFGAIGLSTGDVLGKLTKLTTYIANNFPAISDKVAKYLTPVFQDWLSTIKHLGPVFSDIGSEALRFIGILTGDDSLKDGKVSFDNIGKAVQDVSHGLASFANTVTDTIDIVVHLTAAVGDLLHAGYDFAHFNFAAGLKDLKDVSNDIQQATKNARPGTNAVLGAVTGSGVGAAIGGTLGTLALGPFGTIGGAALGSAIGTAGGALSGYASSKLFGEKNDGSQTIGDLYTKDKEKLKLDYAAAIKGTGVTIAELRALSLTESSGTHLDPRTGRVRVSSTGAIGINQVEPSNANGLNLYDPQQNLRASALTFGAAKKAFPGDVDAAATAYEAGIGKVNQVRSGNGSYGPNAAAYAPAFERNLAKAKQEATVQQQVTINVKVDHPSADGEQIASAVMRKVGDKRNSQLIASYADAGGVFSY